MQCCTTLGTFFEDAGLHPDVLHWSIVQGHYEACPVAMRLKLNEDQIGHGILAIPKRLNSGSLDVLVQHMQNFPATERMLFRDASELEKTWFGSMTGTGFCLAR